ncbi:unnamed protein product [Dicrocoelium dendriticum]|nr:unnamed protein product [Dicrocoelium dendriticum]
MASSDREKKLDRSCTVSPRVYQLAQLLYREFESLRRSYGDAPYGGLLPLCLKILEEMDQLCTDKRQLDLDLNLQIAEKNDLVFQLQRANNLLDTATKRLNYVEDELLTAKKDSDEKIDNLESMLRHHEMLAKNAQGHASRLEERDAQMHAELSTLHERYNDLLKAYVDQTERIKVSDADTGSHQGKQLTDTQSEYGHNKTNELAGAALPRSHANHTDKSFIEEDGYMRLTSPPTSLLEPLKASERVASYITLLGDDAMECESIMAPSSTADHEEEEEDACMMREVEKLINENMELSATKNALNVVKNDLIGKLDDVTGRNIVLAKEIEHLRADRNRIKDGANQTTRLLNECRTQLAHLRTRLKLYEHVDDGGSVPDQRNLALSDVSSQSSEYKSALEDGVATLPTSLHSSPSVLTLSGDADNNEAQPEFPRRTVSVGLDPLSTSSVEGDRPPLVQVDGVGKSGSLHAKLGEPFFTKREMARVIAERNYYKESLLELQDALRSFEELRLQLADSGGFGSPGSPNGRLRGKSSGFARQLLSGIQSVADDVASGLQGLFTEMEPVFTPGLPSEVQQVEFYSPARTTNRSTVDAVQPSELRRMFSRFLGHAAGQAVFGARNDFAATVTSQALADSLPRLLDSRKSECVVSSSPENIPSLPALPQTDFSTRQSPQQTTVTILETETNRAPLQRPNVSTPIRSDSPTSPSDSAKALFFNHF